MSAIRLLGLGLCFILSFSAFAEDCEVVLAGITPQFRLLTSDHPDLEVYRQELEARIRAGAKKSHLPFRPTTTQGYVEFERALFLIAKGQTGFEELLSLAHTATTRVGGSYSRIVELAKLLAPLQKAMLEKGEGLDDASSQQLVQLELQFMVQSRIFGEDYGFVKNLLLLLDSVAAGKGAPDFGTRLNNEDPTDKSKVVFDLTAPNCMHVAKEVLDIWKWNDFPTTEKIRQMFANNRYALIAKLERDAAELDKMNAPWRRVANFTSHALVSGTDRLAFIPQKYRFMFVRLLGLQVNTFMLDMHLGYIQQLVSLGRSRTPEGKIILTQKPEVLDLMIKEVRDQASGSQGDNFLTTFARIDYFNETWGQVYDAVKAKTDSPHYQELLKRMDAARVRANSMNKLTYLHEPDSSRELQLMLFEAGYLALAQELTVGGVHKWLAPWVKTFL